MISDSEAGSQLRLRVVGVGGEQVAPGTIRVAPTDLHRLGAALGDVVAVTGERRTYARVMRTYARDPGHGLVYLSAVVGENANTQAGAQVLIDRVEASFATSAELLVARAASRPNVADLSQLLLGLPVTTGDTVKLEAGSGVGEDLTFSVLGTEPDGPVVLTTETELIIRQSPAAAETRPRYTDIGGLGPQLARIREVVELRLLHPEIFERLGIGAPRGILLHGPPGCGKTLIARAVAHQTSAHFVQISGPEVIHRYYGDSEAHLRQIFEEARQKAPTIIFLDEIDAIAPKREDVTGEVEKRVVAQLMALLDGLDSRGQVIVLAATNLPDNLDPALRRPGRFDRELAIPAPDTTGRLEILRIHTRRMPLGVDVDLDRLAGLTPGYVGADLEALCREAALSALHRSLEGLDPGPESLSDDLLATILVTWADFQSALDRTQPSAIREWGTRHPESGWDAVGGLETVKRDLREAVEWPLYQAEALRHFGMPLTRAVLLTGPPGTGKSLLARTAARATGANLIAIQGPQVLSKWVGESERAIRDIFRRARLAAPSIVLLDDLDALAPNRASLTGSQTADRVVGQLLAELDKLDPRGGVLVIGASNRPDLLDPALLGPGRFERQIVIPLPDVADRRAILAIHTRDKPLDRRVDLDRLAQVTEGLSGAHLAALVQEAARAALREFLGGRRKLSRQRITRRHFQAAAADLGLPDPFADAPADTAC